MMAGLNASRFSKQTQPLVFFGNWPKTDVRVNNFHLLLMVYTHSPNNHL